MIPTSKDIDPGFLKHITPNNTSSVDIQPDKKQINMSTRDVWVSRGIECVNAYDYGVNSGRFSASIFNLTHNDVIHTIYNAIKTALLKNAPKDTVGLKETITAIDSLFKVLCETIEITRDKSDNKLGEVLLATIQGHINAYSESYNNNKIK